MNRNVLASGLAVIVVGLAALLSCPSQAVAGHAVWCGPCVYTCCESCCWDPCWDPCCLPCGGPCCWGPVIIHRPILCGGGFGPVWGFPCGIGCCEWYDCCAVTRGTTADGRMVASGKLKSVTPAQRVIQADLCVCASTNNCRQVADDKLLF